MKAVVCRQFGPRGDLRLEDLPSPVPGPGQIVLRVAACGLNFFDGLMVAGTYQTKPDLPFTPGSEAAGTVVAVGDAVTGIETGDRVLAYLGTGGYGELALAEADRVYPIPDAMSFEQAAGFLITHATSHHALKDRAALQQNETLLVLGAAGGVGLTAVEIGRRMGARVIAAASSDEKLALCRAHGAEETINYSTQDLRQRVKELTGGQGVDVVYDPVGGMLSEAALRSLAVNGRQLVIGFAAGDIPKLPANLLLLKQAALIGVFWGAFARANPERHRRNIAELFSWFEAGELHPHIGDSYPLDRFAEALDAVMERRAQGKVVLTMGEAKVAA